MNLAAVMDEIGDRLSAIPGLRVYRYPPDDISPPAAIVAYPESYTYDGTMRRGMDRVTLPVVVLVGKASDRASRDGLAKYLDGDGTSSVKRAVDTEQGTAFDSARVTGAEIDVWAIASVDYVAAVFEVDIVGQGAAL